MSIYDDPLSLHEELLRIGNTTAGRQYLDSGKLTESFPAEPYEAPAEDATELAADDFVSATAELAELNGASFGQVRDMIFDAHQRSGLGFSEPERAQVIAEVALSMEQSKLRVSDEQILALSGRGGEDAIVLASTISEAERQEAARRGHALSDGSYPIRSVKELQAAAILARSKHGDYRAAAKLIARRARELSVRNPLEDSGPVAASADTMRLALSMAGAEAGETEPLTRTEADIAQLSGVALELARHGQRSRDGRFRPSRTSRPPGSMT